MSLPDAEQVFHALDVTWPAASSIQDGPWIFRDGLGGGKRVSATSALESVSERQISAAEIQMQSREHARLFVLRERDRAFDTALKKRGYKAVDPVTLYVASTADLAERQPPATVFQSWPALAIQKEIWAKCGIGPARLAVMDRAGSPKTALLGRSGDVPAGVAFVSCDGPIAMIHAIEVLPAFRRKGTARRMIQAAALWAQDQSAAHLALAVTDANIPANALYTSLGMTTIGRYHYRLNPSDILQ